MPAMEIYLLFYWLGTVFILQIPIKRQLFSIWQIFTIIYPPVSHRENDFLLSNFWWLSKKNVYRISETGDWRHEGRFPF